jgi:Gpi18-like mannosyltransferase
MSKSEKELKRIWSWKQILTLVSGWSIWLFVLKYLAFRILGYPLSITYIAFQTLGLWDGYWHIQIARFGYYLSGLTLRFPLYPMLVRLFSSVFGGSELAAGLIISFLALFLAVLFVYRLALIELGSERLARRSILLLLLFPTAFFFVAVYGESLFLFLTVSSFYFFRKERLFSASILGGLAALTRPQGLLLFPSFVIARVIHKRQLDRRTAFFLLIPLAIIPWMLFLWQRFGDPLFFIKDLSKWGEGPWQRERVLTMPLGVLFSYVRDIPNVLETVKGGLSLLLFVKIKELSDFFFFILFLFLGGFVYRYLDISYILYYFSSLFLMLSVGTLKGAPRFVLVLFPAYLVLSKLIRKPWIFIFTLFISTIGLVGLLILFTFHLWVA